MTGAWSAKFQTGQKSKRMGAFEKALKNNSKSGFVLTDILHLMSKNYFIRKFIKIWSRFSLLHSVPTWTSLDIGYVTSSSLKCFLEGEMLITLLPLIFGPL